MIIMKNETLETNLMACSAETLTALTGSTLLSQEDMETYRASLPAIEHAFFYTQMFRTTTEMRISVLNDIDFPTADAKYWQSVREMNVMSENLIMLSFTYQEKLLDLKKFEMQRDDILEDEDTWTKIEIERINIHIKRTGFEIACIQREAHHRIREIGEWKNIQDQLKMVLEAGTDDVNTHQLFSYTLRFLKAYQAIETGKVNKDLDSYRNLVAQLNTAIGAIECMKKIPDLMNAIGRIYPELARFIRSKKLIKE